MTRVVCTQPSLAKYRIPVFQQLAQRPNIDLKVMHGTHQHISNVEPACFHTEITSLWQCEIYKAPIYWLSAQVESCSGNDADVTILTWDLHYASLLPALLRAKKNGHPTILWGHGFSKNDHQWRSRMRNTVGRLATCLLVYDTKTAEDLVRAGFDQSRVFVAQNCIDQGPIQRARNQWLACPDQLRSFRQVQKINAGPHILFVSRLNPERRLDLLIQAVFLLKDICPGISVTLIGDGVEERQRLQRLACQLGVERHIRYVDATYDEYQLAPWFMSADIYCQPEQVGLSLFHAFGYGLPTLIADTRRHGPEANMLVDNKNGCRFHPESAEDLAQCIRTLWNQPLLRKKMSLESHRLAQKTYTIGTMVDGIVAAIEFCNDWRAGTLGHRFAA